jgi:hypothetical protein
MEWILKNKHEEGETRIVSRFLFLPTCIDDIYKWLCLAKIEQEYYGGDYYDNSMWLNKKWA